MVLLKRHWWLLWIAWGLSTGLFVASQFRSVDARLEWGAAVLMLIGCVLAARWYVRHGPGPYREGPYRDLRK